VVVATLGVLVLVLGVYLCCCEEGKKFRATETTEYSDEESRKCNESNDQIL